MVEVQKGIDFKNYWKGLKWASLVLLLSFVMYLPSIFVGFLLIEYDFNFKDIFYKGGLIFISSTLACSTFVDFIFSNFRPHNAFFNACLYIIFILNLLFAGVVYICTENELTRYLSQDNLFITTILTLLITFVYSFVVRALIFKYGNSNN